MSRVFHLVQKAATNAIVSLVRLNHVQRFCRLQQRLGCCWPPKQHARRTPAQWTPRAVASLCLLRRFTSKTWKRSPPPAKPYPITKPWLTVARSKPSSPSSCRYTSSLTKFKLLLFSVYFSNSIFLKRLRTYPSSITIVTLYPPI